MSGIGSGSFVTFVMNIVYLEDNYQITVGRIDIFWGFSSVQQDDLLLRFFVADYTPSGTNEQHAVIGLI